MKKRFAVRIKNDRDTFEDVEVIEDFRAEYAAALVVERYEVMAQVWELAEGESEHDEPAAERIETFKVEGEVVPNYYAYKQEA
jgi:hypothetical protein